MHVFVDLIARYPKLTGIVGFAIAIAFAILGVSTFTEMQKIGDAPREASLAEIAGYLAANDRYWVVVTDGAVNCDSLNTEQVGSTMTTEIFIEAPDKSLAMLAGYSPAVTCEEVKASPIHGVAYPMSDRHRSLLAEAGRLDDYPASTNFMELCTTCGRPSSSALFFLSAVMVVLGLSLYPLALARSRARQRPAVSARADELFDQ